MAIGDLIIRMAADVAGLQSDLGKATHMAQQFQRNVGRVLGALGIGFSVKAITDFAASINALHASLDDLSEITGDNVTMLDGIRRQADISGFSIDSLGTSMARLSKVLSSADDDGKGAGQALKSIGLDVESLRSKKPAEAMLDIALAMNKFDDGTGKAAVAMALFGKEGAKMLPLLKDLGEAGELQGKITAEQAAAAEKAEKEFRKLGIAWKDAGSSLVTELVPPLNRLLEQMNEAIRLGGGLSGLFQFSGQIGGHPWRTAGENVEAITKSLEDFTRARDEALAGGDKQRGDDLQKVIDNLKKQKEFAQFLQRQEALAVPGAGEADVLSRRYGARPQVNFREEDREKALKASREAEHIAKQYAEDQEERIKIDAQASQASDDYNKAIRERTYYENAWGEIVENMTLPQMKEYHKLRLESIDADEAHAIVIGQLQGGFDGMGNSLEKVDKDAEALGYTFQSAFEDAVLSGQKLSEVLKGLEKDIARVILRRTITEPLGNAITEGINRSGFLGALRFNLGGGGGNEDLIALSEAFSEYAGDYNAGMFVGAFQHGTDYVPRTGLAMVHKGEQIIPAEEREGGAPSISFNVNAVDAPSFATLLASPAGRRTIEGVVKSAYRRAGRNSGMAS